MYHKKKSKNYWPIVGIVAIFFIMVSYFILQKKTNLTFIEKTIKDSGLVIEKILLSPFQKKNAKQELTDETLKVRNQELENEIAVLKKNLELKTVLTEQVGIHATAINRNMNFWYHTITLDKGKKAGISKNMPVIVKEGLIGVINKVSNYNSEVKLLTNEELNHKISVKIKVGNQYIYGLLTGYNNQKALFHVEGIASNIEIPKGSLVSTTGLGENMPAGIVVGYVKDIIKDHFDLSRLVEVESKVNFDALSYVTVLKRKEEEK